MQRDLPHDVTEAFAEAFPAHKYDVEFSEGMSSTGTDGVKVRLVRRADDHSWLGLVIRKSDIPILIERAKEKMNESA